MKTFSKILIILTALWVLTACTPGFPVNTDTAAVSNAAAQIAEFDLPEGYIPEFSVNVMGYTVAAYNRGDGISHLYLVQSEKESDGEKLMQMLEDVLPAENNYQNRTTVVETRSVTVRGQEEQMVVHEGVNGEGQPYRQALVTFQGNGGPALVVISEPLNRWDIRTVENLIASIQ